MAFIKKLAASSLFVVYALVSLEVVGRICLSFDPILLAVARDTDSGWRLLWIREHQGPAENRYAFDDFNPRYGWSSKKNVRDMQVFGTKILNTNSRGVRGKDDVPYERTPGKKRILVLGDSFTFGEEVSDEETYSARLARAIPESEVLNMGVHGYGHDQMLLYYRDEGARYHPDLVVLGLVSVDLRRNLLGFRDYAKPRFVLHDGGLELTGVPVPEPEYFLKSEIWRPKILDLVRMLSVPQIEQSYPVSAKILGEIAKDARTSGANVAAVFLPSGTEITNDPSKEASGESFYRQTCEKLGVPFLSLRAQFHVAREAGGVKDEPHWKGDGHAIVAENLAGFIARERLLPN